MRAPASLKSPLFSVLLASALSFGCGPVQDEAPPPTSDAAAATASDAEHEAEDAAEEAGELAAEAEEGAVSAQWGSKVRVPVCHKGRQTKMRWPETAAWHVRKHRGDYLGVCKQECVPSTPADEEALCAGGPGGGGGGTKVYVCHVPGGDLSKAHTIHVGRPGACAHLREHEEDTLGPCPADCRPPPNECPPNGNPTAAWDDECPVSVPE
jgi:hypothetical protein